MGGRLHGLDALRGVAALGVAFGFHLNYYLGVNVSPWLDSYGWTLVDLFFVLSGFVFAALYADRLPARDTFFRARFARLYPLHILTFAATAVLLLWLPPLDKSNNNFATALAHLFMMHEQGVGKSFNVPSWSLAVEVYCYVIFYALARAGKLKAVAPWIVACCFALSPFVDFQVNHLLRGGVGFFTGCLLAIHRPPLKLVAIPALAALLYTLPEVNRGIWYSVTLWPALVLIVIRLPQLDQIPLATYFGERSYTIYLVHYPVFILLRDAPPLLLIATVIGVSHLVYGLYERPLRDMLRSPLTDRLWIRPSADARKCAELGNPIAPGALKGRGSNR